MPFYSRSDWTSCRKLTLWDVDIIKNHGYYIPPETNVEELDQKLQDLSIYTHLAWYIRDQMDRTRPKTNLGAKHRSTYYILARDGVSRVVEMQSPKANQFAMKVYQANKKCTYDTHKPPILVVDKFYRFWKGQNTTPNAFRSCWHGNALLIKLTEDGKEYIELSGNHTYKYTLNDGEEIKVYYAPINTDTRWAYASDHPGNLKDFYSVSWAVTNQGRVLHHGKIIDDPLGWPKTPFFSLLYRDYFKKIEAEERKEAGVKFNDWGEELFCQCEDKDDCTECEQKMKAKRVTSYPPGLGHPYPIDEMDVNMWNIDPIKNSIFFSVKDLDQRPRIIEQIKLINWDYLERIDWSYLNVSNQELDIWRPYDKNRQDQYQIMTNGYCNFGLRESAGQLKIYNEYEWSEDQAGHDFQNFKGEPCLVLDEYLGYWIGLNNSEHYHGAEHGNTIIIHVKENQYIAVETNVVEFTLPAERSILAYYSPIGNNGVPYPLIILDDESIVFNYRIHPADSFCLPKTPLFGNLINNQIYGGVPNIGTYHPSIKLDQIERLVNGSS